MASQTFGADLEDLGSREIARPGEPAAEHHLAELLEIVYEIAAEKQLEQLEKDRLAVATEVTTIFSRHTS